VAGAALDVFSQEPPPASNPLLGRDDVIVTPHLGASTTEAQLDVAREIAQAVLGALKGEAVSSVVNAPMIASEQLEEMRPFMELAEKLARLAIQVAPSELSSVHIIYEGAPALLDTRPLKAAVIKGLLEPISMARINRVNAELVAKQRGLHITEVKCEESQGAVRDTISIQLGDNELHRYQGAILRGSPRVIRIQNFWIDLELNGYILLCRNEDQPGTIGKVGTVLGRKEINISFMQVGRNSPREMAVMAIGLDELPPSELVEEIAALPSIAQAKLIQLG
jgi:D-3-phosphoglycerate dehydrogenase